MLLERLGGLQNLVKKLTTLEIEYASWVDSRTPLKGLSFYNRKIPNAQFEIRMEEVAPNQYEFVLTAHQFLDRWIDGHGPVLPPVTIRGSQDNVHLEPIYENALRGLQSNYARQEQIAYWHGKD